MATFKHAKKRDTGLMYEFLVRKLSQAMVEHDSDNMRKTLEITRKYFGDGAVLSEERELFDVVRNARGLTESAARRVLAEVQRVAKSMDPKRIDIKKSNLIKEINYNFGKSFYSQFRIPEYRLLASIQMVIDAARTKNRLTESVQNIQLEEGLIRYMMTRGSFSETMSQRSEVDSLVMAMMAKRFSEKYNRSLSTSQKSLFERYIRFQVTGDAKPLSESINVEIDYINETLDRAATMQEITEDSAMSQKLTEAKSRLVSVESMPLEKQVEELMTYQKLVEEVNSDE